MSGPECCSNPPALNPSSGRGLKAYVTGSPDFERAVLLVSDVLGNDAPNLRKLAGMVADVGFYVVVPDFFYGEPYDPENRERPMGDRIKDRGMGTRGASDTSNF